jgi:transposase
MSAIQDIHRVTRKRVWNRGVNPHRAGGRRGEESIVALCRREGIAESLIYRRSKELLEASKKWLTGNTARAAATVPT